MFSLNLLLTNLIPLCDRVNRTLSSHSSSSQMPQLGAPQRSAQIFAHVAILKIKSSVKIQSAPDLGKVIRVSLIFWKSSATQREERRVQASGVSKRTHTYLWRDCTVSRSWRGAGGFSKSEDDWQKMSGTTRRPHTGTAGRCQMLHDKKEGRLTRKKKKWHLQRVMSSFQTLSQIRPRHSSHPKSFCAQSMIK